MDRNLKGNKMTDDKKARIAKIEKELKRLHDPYEEQRQKLLTELSDLRRENEDIFFQAAKGVRKLLADDIKQLKKMCKASFKETVTLKATVKVDLEMRFDSAFFEHEESGCYVDFALPKNMSGLRPFLEDSDCVHHIDGEILNHDEGFNILPQVSDYLREARSLHGKLIKRIREEYKKLKLDPDEVEYFCGEVLSDVF